MATYKSSRPIVGFIHVCMINDFLEILKEQINLMKESGLYDAANVINICCLGNVEGLKQVKEFIQGFGKLRLAAHSTNLEEFEFLTLGFIKEISDRSGNFFGFYVHSKGVSWPGHEGGKYWRDYMNYYIITDWISNVKNLDLGYETSGVKLINKGWPLHYSGNFFWFSSIYVKELIAVNRMNLKDRFNAEMWICSGKPIAATLCQMFVDYNTKGIFEPPKDGKDSQITQ